MFTSLRVLKEPRAWVIIMIGFGALWLAFIILAAAQRPGGDPADVAQTGARSVVGFTATDPARRVPPYPLAGPSGAVQLDQLPAGLALVQFIPPRCRHCETASETMSAAILPDGAIRRQVILKGAAVPPGSDTSTALHDEIGSFDRFLPSDLRAPVILVIDARRQLEIGRFDHGADLNSPAAQLLLARLAAEALRP